MIIFAYSIQEKFFFDDKSLDKLLLEIENDNLIFKDYETSEVKSPISCITYEKKNS